MNRAAVELNMVQSNVTAHIRTLEEQVGTQLFDRSRRGVMLTGGESRQFTKIPQS
jgi:DNA-binding transcriptional LysR family regulator